MEHCELDKVRLPCHDSNWERHLTLLRNIEHAPSLTELETLIAESQRLTWRRAALDQGALRKALHSIESLLTEEVFLRTLLPWIVSQVLQMPTLFPTPLQPSKSGHEMDLVWTKPQEVCLMAAFFLCHLPLPHWHYYHGGHVSHLKLVSIIVFLQKHFLRDQEGSLRTLPGLKIHRSVLTTPPMWETLDTPLCPVRVEHSLLIQDHPEPCLRIDFANEWIGGGVLSGGNVQEELCFSIYPSLQLTMLVCQVMLPSDAIVVTGAERVTNYTGYGHTAKFDGIYDDQRTEPHIEVAMDAGVFIGNRYTQYEERQLKRELNKAYIGFLGDPSDTLERPVVTGNWGCGMFGGDHQLKACLQWMAASVAGKSLVYCCFKNKIMEGLGEFVGRMRAKTVGELYRQLLEVREELISRQPLFEVLSSV